GPTRPGGGVCPMRQKRRSGRFPAAARSPPSTAGPYPPPRAPRSHPLPDREKRLFPVVEMVLFALDLLVGLVPLPGDQHQVAPFRHEDGAADRLPAIHDDLERRPAALPRPFGHLAADLRRVFAAG